MGVEDCKDKKLFKNLKTNEMKLKTGGQRKECMDNLIGMLKINQTEKQLWLWMTISNLKPETEDPIISVPKWALGIASNTE